MISYKQQVGFSSKPLFNINLRKFEEGVEKGLEPAKIVMLSPKNIGDLSGFNTLLFQSVEIEATMDWIRKKFINGSTMILGVEAQNPLSQTCKKLFGFAQIDLNNLHPQRLDGDNSVEVLNLYSLRSEMHPNPLRNFKGIGENLLYGACKLNKMLHRERVTLTSENNSFYDAVKMPRAPYIDGKCRCFQDNSLLDFISRIEEKYQIQSK